MRIHNTKTNTYTQCEHHEQHMRNDFYGQTVFCQECKKKPRTVDDLTDQEYIDNDFMCGKCGLKEQASKEHELCEDCLAERQDGIDSRRYR